MVDGYTTGYFGGFWQDQDPLYAKAQDAILALAGGIPSVSGILSSEEFTLAAIQLLEGICFREDKKAIIEDALKNLDEAVNMLEKTKQAFKSRLVADARERIGTGQRNAEKIAVAESRLRRSKWHFWQVYTKDPKYGKNFERL